MSRNFITAGTKAFTPINNVLQEVTIEKVFFKSQENEEGEKYFVCTGYEVSFNNTTEDLPPSTDFYYNEECFKNGERIPKSASHYWFLSHKRWYYDGMCAAAYHAVDHVKSFYYTKQGGFTIVDGFFPELYTDKEDVYAYNDLRIAYEDGRTEVRKGYLSSLLLNDEQKALKAEFEALAERMRAASMTMMVDESEDIYFVNNEKLSGRGNCTYYESLLVNSQKANTKLVAWYVSDGGELPIRED